MGEEDASELRQTSGKNTLDQITHFVYRFISQSTPENVCSWIDHGAGEPSKRFWTLDPIDGTKGFLRGDQYAVALALLVDGQVEIGVLGCPNLAEGSQAENGDQGTLAVAVRGEGAWITSLDADVDSYQQLGVSDITSPTQARVLRSFESGHTNISQIDYFSQELHVEVEPVRMDSQAKYAILARGEASIYLRLPSPDTPEYRERIWDHAAGTILIEEAGGRATDAFGTPLDFCRGRRLEGNQGIVTTNGLLHEAVLEAVKLEIGELDDGNNQRAGDSV